MVQGGFRDFFGVQEGPFVWIDRVVGPSARIKWTRRLVECIIIIKRQRDDT